MNSFLYLFLCSLVCFTTVSCSKDAPTPSPRNAQQTSSPEKIIKDGERLISNKRTITVNATDFEKWTYFSFEKGILKHVDKPEHDRSWDLAFRRTFTKTNSGTSGPGKGGAAETAFKNLKDIELRFIKTNPYVTDTIQVIPVERNGGGNGQNIKESVNKALRGIFISDMSQMPPAIGYSDLVYFVRTANGKFAAVLFTNYEKEISTTEPLKRGYVSFDYIYPLN